MRVKLLLVLMLLSMFLRYDGGIIRFGEIVSVIKNSWHHDTLGDDDNPTRFNVVIRGTDGFCDRTPTYKTRSRMIAEYDKIMVQIELWEKYMEE